MTVRVETWKCVSYRSDFSNVVLVLSVQIISSSTAFFLDAKITPKSWKRTFENYNLWIPELWKVQILWFSSIYWNKAIYIPFQQSKISSQNSSKNFIVVAYSKIDKNDLLTWTDYQQNKKVEFLTEIFTFHLLPKILSRISIWINFKWRQIICTQRNVRVLTAGVSWTGMYPACHMCEHF